MVSSPWWSLFLEDLWLSFSQRWWGFDPPRRQAGSFVAWPWRPGGRSRPDPSEAAFALCAARLQKLVVNSRVYSIYCWWPTTIYGTKQTLFPTRHFLAIFPHHHHTKLSTKIIVQKCYWVAILYTLWDTTDSYLLRNCFWPEMCYFLKNAVFRFFVAKITITSSIFRQK